MVQLNSALLAQFDQHGLTLINEGIAVDACLIRSASRPLSNEKLNELREKQNTPECKLDKTGKLKKFSRWDKKAFDLESDWTIKNDKPHSAVDVENGFILSTNITPASQHDST